VSTDVPEKKRGIKHILVKISRILGWTFFSVFVLLIAIILLVRVPAVQNKIAQRAITYLEGKIKTNVELQSITIDFPKKIVIEGLYIEDQKKDTLLYAGRLAVDAGMLGLLHNEINLAQVELENSTAVITRNLPDSVFNFDYIIDAFAGTDTATVTPTDTTSSPWKFSLGTVEINNVRFRYEDAVSSIKVFTRIGEFETDADEFDPMKMIFKLDDITLKNSEVGVALFAPVVKELPSDIVADTTSLGLFVGFKTTLMENVRVRYSDAASNQQLDARIGTLEVDADEIDLNNQRIVLDEVTLKKSFVSFHQKSIVDSTSVRDTMVNATPFQISPWAVSVADINLEGNSIDYADFGYGTMKDSFDPNHLWIMNLTLVATNVKVDTTSAEIDLENLSFNEKNGISIRSLAGNIKVNPTETIINDFDLQYGNSRLAMSGKASYPSLTILTTDIARVSGEISIKNSYVVVSDILKFQPDLLDSIPLDIPLDTRIALALDAKGSIDEASVSKLEVSTFDSTYFSITGAVKGLHDLNTAIVNAQLKQFRTSRNDMSLILPDSLMPDSVELPKYVVLTGDLKGTAKKPDITTKLTTDLGIITADAKFDLAEIPQYQAKVTARAIQAGKLSGIREVGNVNFDLSVDGQGFDMQTLDTKIDLLVQELIYNDYRFTEFKLNGTMVKYLFAGTASLNDENLAFDLDADLDYNSDTPVYKATFDLKNLNLKELNISERPLRARLTVDVDLTTNDFQVMNGRLDIRKVAVFNGTRLYSVDSMLFASLDQEGHSKMSIRSDILSGDFEGTFNIFSISEKLKDHFEQYFAPIEKKEKSPGLPQNFTFDLKLKNTDLLTEVLVPELEPFTPGVIRGEFDSEQNKLNLVMRMPKLQYSTAGVDSLVVLVNSNAEELSWLFKLDRLVADTIVIDQVNLTGVVSHDSIRTAFNVLDSLDQKKYAIGAHIRRDGKMMNIHLDDEDLFLNYSKWSVPVDNYLVVGNGVVAANNFEVVKQNQKVIMIGDTRKDPAITIRFEDLELGNLTRIISGVVPASGELNGDFKFTTKSSGKFSSKMSISDLTVLQKPLGDLTLGIDHSKDQYNVALKLRGNKTDLETTGTYGGPKGNEQLNLVANIVQMNMEAVQAFSMGQITNASGIIKGKIDVKGRPSHPDIAGNLTFSEVNLHSTYLNTNYTLKNEIIAISNDIITLNNFTIADDQNNTAQLKGKINISSYIDPAFDLTLTTKNFQVLNTKEGDNELFYGLMKINATARVSGNAQLPKATVKLSFTDDTNFTYVVPTSERAVMEAEGIVKFVDRDAQGDPFLQSLDARDTVHAGFSGIEMSAVIDLTDKETLNVVIDPGTGDRLSVQGNASLILDMTTSGNMNLSGRYEITRGTYNISFYNLVKRKFEIVKGSSITWSGDPLNANMDIRASNLVETSPLDLVSNQAQSTESSNNFNQRLPFLVYLNIKGQLLAPQISFQLDMPADKRNANGGIYYSRLQDINSRESDLNKQVFALLILKRFVADNPFESSSGAGVSNTARTSVSRLLSEQLNRLSENVKGVQLSFDIKSYEQAGVEGSQGTTKAQLGVSKSLFDDRLVVKLSGNVDIEGEEAGSDNVTDYIGDLALEYKMTQDGRFRVTGFRNSNYDMIDGELTETGAGFIYIKDYNTLRELFKANEIQIK
jgi:translocation and assembly module TamB